jgi:tetraacyldisaccharide 4'-kinase
MNWWLGRGPIAVALLPVTALYALLSGLHRWLYRVGWLKTQRVGVPVIVVGNLIAGGAGKTPTVIAVVDLLRRQGFVPGIVSRGHGRSGPGVVHVQPATPVRDCGDEPKLLHLRTGAPVTVGRDRVAACRALLRQYRDVDAIVCDDGLQHHRLARNAQVIVFDERGVGNRWLLPAGPLREPLRAMAPARSVVLYNAAAPTTHWPGNTAQRSLRGITALHNWWRGDADEPRAVTMLRGRRVLAAAGIAKPERFFNMLRELGLKFDALPLPDHYPYTRLPWPDSDVDVIVTEKDAVKIEPRRAGRARIWVAALDFRPGAGFEAQLLALLPAAPRA